MRVGILKNQYLKDMIAAKEGIEFMLPNYKDDSLQNFRTLVLDVSDLISYLDYHRYPSGIQRVQLNIVSNIIQENSITDFVEIKITVIDEKRNDVLIIDQALVINCIDAIRSERTSHEEIRRQLAYMREQSHSFEVSEGVVYVVTGAFWNFSSASHMFRKLKSAGAALGCLVYDIIPITHPEFFPPSLVSSFRKAFIKCLPSFDFIVTISEFTAQEVADFVKAGYSRNILIKPVRLAHTIEDRQGEISLLRRSQGIPPFVLCVGTIESRKNHLYLFNLWKILLKEKQVSVPKLVIVGRWGWRVNDLREQMEATNFLDGHIIILNEVDDQTLSWLYTECIFTIFVSYVEGWGLPVGESIAHGRVCVASNISSITEVAPDFTIYIDPHSVRQGKNVIENILRNSTDISSIEDRIKDNFRARNWRDYVIEFTSAISEIVNHPKFFRSPPSRMKVNINEIVTFDDKALKNDRKDADINNIELIFDHNWYESEPIGKWMRMERGG